MRVLIAVTHLLGAGHLTRAAALARAFAARGHVVALASGGMPSPLIDLTGVERVQLPPVRTIGTDFRTLLDEDGRPAGAERMAARQEMLLKALREAQPDVVITELFPFGRRVLAAEFMALLEAAHRLERRPLVAASVRDILVAPNKPERIAKAHGRLRALYDLVLVHGDPDLIPLDASWPVERSIAPFLRYTGYVDEGAVVEPAAERSGILASGGSSAASLPLYRAALEAARAVPEEPWRILVGRGVPDDAFLSIKTNAPAHVTVERARPDFRHLLASAAVSVSQAGYNTAVDLLQAGPAAVLVPFEAGHETEQRQRAERLRDRGLAQVIPEAELSGERLASEVREALVRRPATRTAIAVDGAARSVTLLEGALAAPTLRRAAVDWRPLREALAAARDRGVTIRAWWRDDDAVADTPALRRLLDLGRTAAAPIAIAAIPQAIAPCLAAALAEEPGAVALVHGLTHRNWAPPGEKKAEFGPHRPLPALAGDAAAALAVARAALGHKLVPVFVPPWNRIAPDLLPRLAGLGYRGVSTFNDRRALQAAPGLAQVNTHCDPIDWRGSRSLADPSALVARLAAAVLTRIEAPPGVAEPIGLLTHHLVHDEAVWGFCEAVLEEFRRNSVPFALAEELFCGDNRIVVEL
ncbi:MAG TPA: glycosyltransferase [Microvirga sp.]|jgi:predicted glycosyltransferase